MPDTGWPFQRDVIEAMVMLLNDGVALGDEHNLGGDLGLLSL
jgi:hypothetical protein